MNKAINKTGISLLVVAVLILSAFLLGPREEIQVKPIQIALPDDLGNYLNQAESRYPDIVPGTEKEILWAHADKRKTPFSIIYLHGFSASRGEVFPLCDNLASRLGANLYYARLTGHGRTGSALAEVRAEDWMKDAMEALAIGERIGGKVIVISTSTGSTLARWLAHQPEGENIFSHVMISPNFGLRSKAAGIITLTWGGLLARLILGREIQNEALSEEHARFWTLQYPTSAVVTMLHMVRYVNQLDASEIDEPVLLIYSPLDTVVHPKKAERFFNQLGSADKHLVPVNQRINANNHVLAGDIRAPDNTQQVQQVILDFLEDIGVGMDPFPSP